MKRQLSVVMAAGVSLLLALTACANPQTGQPSVKASDVGSAIKVSKDDAIAAQVPTDFRQRGTFTGSINPDVAPVKFVDSDGKLAGLVPELLNDAAIVMGMNLDLQRGSFDAMVPGLESKRFDVIASIGDFKEREQQIDFIDYLNTGTAILTSASFAKDKVTPQDLCGLRVGFARGTAQQGLIDNASKQCVADGKKEIQSTGYGDAGAGVLAVRSSQSDAFWGDSPSMLYNAKTSPNLYKVVYEAKIGPYGIGINKDNAQFRDALRAALLKLVQTGVYDQLLQKWGQQGDGMPDLPLNTGPKLNS